MRAPEKVLEQSPTGERWTKVNAWQKAGVILATIVAVMMAISLAALPLFTYNWTGGPQSDQMRSLWIWGWADVRFTYWKGWFAIPPASTYTESYDDYSTCTDCFYPAAILGMIFGAISLLVYIGVSFHLRGKMRKDAVFTIRATTGWTWIWAVSLAIASSYYAGYETAIQQTEHSYYLITIMGPPSVNAWIALAAAIVLAGICWVTKPTNEERAELQERLTLLKLKTATFYASETPHAISSEVDEVVNHADEIGARKIRKQAQTYVKFLPKLWTLYQAFVIDKTASLSALRAQLQMEAGDASKIILELARKFQVTIDGDTLISRPNLDGDELMKFSEQLLHAWETEVQRRQAAVA